MVGWANIEQNIIIHKCITNKNNFKIIKKNSLKTMLNRTSSNIVTWAFDKYTDSVPAPEVLELVGKTEYKACIEKLLPHILACSF